MDVRALYSVIAAVDCGSFAEAAKALDISISSVSLQIRALEHELKLDLFDRSTRPPRVTEEGLDFVARARDLLRQWDALSGGPGGAAARVILKIGAVHTAVAGSLPPALRKFRAARPETPLRLTTGLTHELEDLVLRRRLDCALVTGQARIDPALGQVTIAGEPMVLIAHRSVTGRDVRRILADHPYVRFNHRARVAQLVESALASMGLSPSSTMEIGTLDAVISLVANRLGVSIVPLNAGGVRFGKSIRAIPFGTPPVVRELCVIFRKDSPKTALIDQLGAELRAQFA